MIKRSKREGKRKKESQDGEENALQIVPKRTRLLSTERDTISLVEIPLDSHLIPTSAKNKDMALIATYETNPPGIILKSNLLQLDGIVDMLMETDRSLKRPQNTSLYFSSRTEARELVYVLLYFVKETTDNDHFNLFDKSQKKFDSHGTPICNWRWAFTTCPITSSGFLNALPQTIQRFANKWSRAMKFDGPTHYGLHFATLLAYIIHLFYGAQHGSISSNARLSKNAQCFLENHKDFYSARLCLDFTCSTVQLLRITKSTYPYAASLDASASGLKLPICAESNEHPVDTMLGKMRDIQFTAKKAHERLKQYVEERNSLIEMLKSYEQRIMQEEKIISESNNFCDTIRFALQVGSAVVADTVLNPTLATYINEKTFLESESDVKYFIENYKKQATNRTIVKLFPSTIANELEEDLSVSSEEETEETMIVQSTDQMENKLLENGTAEDMLLIKSVEVDTTSTSAAANDSSHGSLNYEENSDSDDPTLDIY